MHRRHRCMHRLHHLLVLMRAGDGEHARMAFADAAFLDAEAAGDDDAAVLGHGLADGVEAFLLGAVEEAAGVHDDDVGAAVVGRHAIALGPQLGQDALAESTSALGQPSETKPTVGTCPRSFGAGAAIFTGEAVMRAALARAASAGEPRRMGMLRAGSRRNAAAESRRLCAIGRSPGAETSESRPCRPLSPLAGSRISNAEVHRSGRPSLPLGSRAPTTGSPPNVCRTTAVVGGPRHVDGPRHLGDLRARIS